MGDALLPALLKVVFGSLAGGITNTVAVWMLFHPYEPPRILGRWRIGFLQGAIPRAQPRLAASIGRTVGNRLLTPEDLAATFQEDAFRKAFDSRLANFIDSALHTERGSLRELVPARVAEDIEAMLGELADTAVARLEAHLASDEFELLVAARTEALSDRMSGEPVGSFLTPSRQLALQHTVGDWLSDAVDSPGFEDTVAGYVERAARQVLDADRTLEEIVPPGLVDSLERVISAYLPLAASRLGHVLDDRAVRNRVEATIQDLLKRFLGDLRIHKRVIARLVMTDDMVNRVLDTIQAEGSERMARVLQEGTVQEALSRGIREGIVDLLRRPVAEVVGAADAPAVVEARRSLGAWVVGLARDPATRSYVDRRLRSGMEGVSEKTWGDVMEYLPRERLVPLIVDIARSRATSRVFRDIADRLIHNLLDRPIGVPARWLPEDAAARIETAVGDPLWDWLQTQIPVAVEQIDVAARVEDKILHYPMERLEELIRRVTRREMRLIVRLGFVLGAVVGASLVLVEWLIG